MTLIRFLLASSQSKLLLCHFRIISYFHLQQWTVITERFVVQNCFFPSSFHEKGFRKTSRKGLSERGMAYLTFHHTWARSDPGGGGGPNREGGGPPGGPKGGGKVRFSKKICYEKGHFLAKIAIFERFFSIF